MRKYLLKFTFIFMASPILVLAQKENYTPLPLNDLSAFENPTTNWSIQGTVNSVPITNSKVKIKAGNGILVGVTGTALNTKLKANDLKFFANFLISPGATGHIILPDGNKILLADSYQEAKINANTMGYVTLLPVRNTSKAPGLWQKIEISYDATVPNIKNYARINSLKINDIIVLESVYLPYFKPLSNTGESIGFEVNKGTIAFRNIGYQLLENKKPLAINNLKYKVFSDGWESKNFDKLDHEGTSMEITQEVTNGLKEFHLFYTGNMEVQEAGDYQFTTIYSGSVCSLEIDGNLILNTEHSTSQDSHSATKSLSKGNHTFKLYYARFPWRAPALGLIVEKSGIRPYDLHALSSLPIPDPKPYISVIPETQPEMIRSFILLPGETTKRTKCISVGSPNGWNYTMDLDRGALLQAWRGQFADVTEMWYSRGEPQLLYPAGLTISVTGNSSYAKLTNSTAAWPDSAAINFKGYSINADGYPIYSYQTKEGIINDLLLPSKNGIIRTISKSFSDEYYALMAQAQQITEVEKGLFEIDGSYYIQTDKKEKAIIRKGKNGQELIIPFFKQVSYTLFW